MKHLALIVTALLLAGCAGPRHAGTYQTQRDSTYQNVQQLDSLFRAYFKRDSIYQRDSIYIYQRGDTVTKYVERTEYRLEQRTDTVYRNKVYTDTLYVARTDSIKEDVLVYMDKPLKWHDKGFIWMGRLCCAAILIWALSLYLKRKFK